ncbi:MAG TPA: HypC/HybG/HupF family hydrogenase formation chaperone [Acidobacteriaceae bacterium]|nr:HypC/HybG/HupF family hydrogenase formation chaperone [Acidobacteriaceae bacterium]
MCLAIPGKVMTIAEEAGCRMARVQFEGVTQPVSLDLLPEASEGDYVLVHVGFAISRIDEGEAAETLRALKVMGMLEGELPPQDQDGENAVRP